MFDLDPWTFLTILAMGVVTVITRGFFFLSDTDWSLPHWARLLLCTAIDAVDRTPRKGSPAQALSRHRRQTHTDRQDGRAV